MSLMQLWLVILALFLAASALTFCAFPEDQVGRLLEHAQEQAMVAGCNFPCARRKDATAGAPWFRAGCSFHCGGPWHEQDFGLAPHLVKALGTTYGTLGLLAVVLSLAPPYLRIAGAQCFTVWSLAQVASSAAPFLSPEDADRRFSFHCTLVALNSLASAWAVLTEC